MRIVAVSDSHNNNLLSKMKDLTGDLLIHAGDLTALGRHGETEKAMRQLAQFKDRFTEIILVAGNHDFLFEREPGLAKQIARENGIRYLEDNGFEFQGKYIYGTPWTPTFYDWAFMTDEAELARKYHWIPEDTDILISHGPPRFILDKNYYKENCGSWALAERVKIVKPAIHIFGHLHPSHGVLEFNDTKFVNAAMCNDRNELVRDFNPIVLDL